MNEIIPGELWFEIAKLGFDVWRALTKTIRVFWLYVQKMGREKIVEKLFGSAYVTNLGMGWFIAGKQHRFGGLPFAIGTHGHICWHREDRSTRGNPLYICDFRMRFEEQLRYRREICYNGRYIIGDVVCDPDDICTLSVEIDITTSVIYFRPGTHRYSIHRVEEDGMLLYGDFVGLRDQNLPWLLHHDGTFSSIL